jgi:hypothetical protein
MTNYLLYLAAGSTHTVNECRYSLLKYLAVYNLKPPPDIGIIVYTDVPATLEAFEAFFNQFELNEVKSVVPFKLEILKEVLSLKQGNILFVNTDTYFVAPVDVAFQTLKLVILYFTNTTTLIMTFPEFQKIKDHLSKNNIEVEGEKISYLPGKDFYSTEIIGANSGGGSLVQNMCSLYSELFRHSSAEASEAFACTYYASDFGVQTME